jgi:hypothetical protein
VAYNGPRGARRPRPVRKLPGGDLGKLARHKLKRLTAPHGAAVYWHGCRCSRCVVGWQDTAYLHDHTNCLICDELADMARSR